MHLVHFFAQPFARFCVPGEVMDATSLTFADESFDIVIDKGVIPCSISMPSSDLGG